jgi:hypothetical protein
MPSAALLRWQTDRLPRLAEVDAQCAATLAVVPPPALADENLRGYVMLLSAHFQGYCRDLHTECVQVVAAASASPAIEVVVQTQGIAGRELDGANPRYETLRKDFERFAFDLVAALAANPANALRVTHIGHLNSWRNYAAHHKTTPPTAGGPFNLAAVRVWRDSCDGLATALDGIMYNRLQAVLGGPPW